MPERSKHTVSFLGALALVFATALLAGAVCAGSSALLTASADELDCSPRQHEGYPSETRSPQRVPGMRELSDQVNALRSVIENLHREVSEIGANRADCSEPGVTDGTSRKPTLEHSTDSTVAEARTTTQGIQGGGEQPNMQARVSESIAQLDFALESEARDEVWALPLEDEIRVALGEYEGISADSVECKTSICKIVFSFQDESSARLFMEDAFMKEPLRGNTRMMPRDIVRPLDDVQLFIAREEFKLPRTTP